MRISLFPVALLVLASCSQGEPAPADTATPAPGATAIASPPSPSDTPARIARIPDRFHGIWDYERGSCDPASDLRVEIAERGITFYESHGAVTAVEIESPESIVAELAMQGEGEKWTMRRRFTLSNGGATLTPSGVGDEVFEPMPLKRCQS